MIVALLSAFSFGCTSQPDYSHMRLTEKDRQTLREWAPAFGVLCAAEQLRECKR